MPIDGACCCLLFAITNNPVWGQKALFNVWSNGGDSYGFLISGKLPGALDVYRTLARALELSVPSQNHQLGR